MMSDPTLSREIFEKEVNMCREFFQKQGGCNWGKCEQCGAVPLLYKLNKGEVYESVEEVAELKKRVFGTK